MPIGASIAIIIVLFVALTVAHIGLVIITRKDTIKTQESEVKTSHYLYKIYSKLERPLLKVA
jgi:hypothetical protein